MEIPEHQPTAARLAAETSLTEIAGLMEEALALLCDPALTGAQISHAFVERVARVLPLREQVYALVGQEQATALLSATYDRVFRQWAAPLARRRERERLVWQPLDRRPTAGSSTGKKDRVLLRHKAVSFPGCCSVKEAAAIIGVSTTTIYKAIHRQTLPALRYGVWFVLKEETVRKYRYRFVHRRIPSSSPQTENPSLE